MVLVNVSISVSMTGCMFKVLVNVFMSVSMAGYVLKVLVNVSTSRESQWQSVC